jgi:hypothetical protein
MKKRSSLMSVMLALVVLPEPMTTVIAIMSVCLWCLFQRRRSSRSSLCPMTISA